MFRRALENLLRGENLKQEEIKVVMEEIMEGKATPAQIASFLTALRIKGETIEEITECAKVMKSKAETITPVVEYSIDTCGTGGDVTNTFNVSTAVALVASAAEILVAKHGNRSVSSKCGSADVLEALGVNINLTPTEVKKSIEDIGIGFMFAPLFHKSMKFAAQPRKELGIRTIFNILGPLTNPAGVKGQVLGVYDKSLVRPIACVLRNLGVKKAMVIHGKDGMDEISLICKTIVCELNDGKINEFILNPEEYGMKLCHQEELKGGNAKENADIIFKILSGNAGPKYDMVVLNSAAALYVGNKVKDLNDGINMAKELINSGKALKKLEEFVEYTNKIACTKTCG